MALGHKYDCYIADDYVKCIWNWIRSMNLTLIAKTTDPILLHYSCGPGIEESDYSNFDQLCLQSSWTEKYFT